MDQIDLFVGLFGIVAIVGILFRNSTVPISLLLVIAGMLISFIPFIPHIGIRPDLVLDFLLPLLIYQTSAYTSWVDVKKNLRPIALLSIGHVIFITLLVAITMHYLIPNLGWPLAFVLGAVISPPDDVAIISIAEKVRMPRKIVTILIGESMLNDATALILFRFSLAALATYEFSAAQAISTFLLVVIGETVYGLLVGHVIGQIRLRLHDPILQMTISLLTPFIAYLPAARMGGCGVVATVVTGLLIGHHYAENFMPDVRLTSRSVWTTLSFLAQSIIFLFVGLDLRYILSRISIIPTHTLALYCIVVILVVIVGRFLWVYPALYLPRILFPSIRKKDPYPPWQYAFVISWAGMRGGISLAAAVAVPQLAANLNGVSPRDLLIFLVFCVITATLLVQGLALPWLLNILGIKSRGEIEKLREQIVELSARLAVSKAVLHWLSEYKMLNKSDAKKTEAIEFHIHGYETLKKQLENRIKNQGTQIETESATDADLIDSILIESEIIDVERVEVLQLWRTGKISHAIKNKLIGQLDLRSKHVEEFGA